MRKTIIAAALALLATPVLAATPEQAADALVKSIAAVRMEGSTVNNCTATKIGEGKYLTALHCIEAGETLVLPSGRIIHVKSVLVAQQNKTTGTDHTRFEDWAVINTVETDDGLTALTLGCNEEPKLGQEVAYGGYPYPTQFAFATGRVTSLRPSLDENSNFDVAMDVHSAPGASGSAVISMETGEVLGVLTEGVLSRFGAFFIGFESIKNTDMCEGQPVKADNTKPTLPSEDALAK